MVVHNSMLHTLSNEDVHSVSDRFPELRHRLLDHAEDYQRVQAAAVAAQDVENLSTIKAKKVTTGRAAVAVNQDPLAILKAQLSQQDAKLEQMSGMQPIFVTTQSTSVLQSFSRERVVSLRVSCADSSGLFAPQRKSKASWTC
eukprot:COSAG02_NODE_3966_length_5976_cov_2.712949_2_plen_143_part_00